MQRRQNHPPDLRRAAGNLGRLFTGNIRITKTKSGSTITTKVGTLHKDGLGSVRAVTDEAGLAAERTTYRPFGEEVVQLTPLTLPETKGFIPFSGFTPSKPCHGGGRTL
ncbi:MAG: hypothetical protein WA822_14660 [Albidovulum sp.]